LAQAIVAQVRYPPRRLRSPLVDRTADCASTMAGSAPSGGRWSHGALALGLLLGCALASPQRGCTAEGGCAARGTLGPALLQQKAVVQKAAAAGLEDVNATFHGSGCAQRLGRSSSRPAACVVIQGKTALLVYVPYGRRPGWDLPGGWHKNGEAPCETAEREVCEETGMSVRAVARLSGSVFKCRITGTNVCTKPVDEGFLKKRFFRKHELHGLKLRGGSWGDKAGFLHRTLAEGHEPPSGPPSVDACGCRPGADGWSTTTRECKATSQTSPEEAIGCQRRRNSADFDVCGCRRGAQGWSSTRQRCSTTSKTSRREADRCRGMVLRLATAD